MSSRARKHAASWIQRYQGVEAQIIAAEDHRVGTSLVLDMLESVEEERHWVREHRQEWAGDRDGRSEPWTMYRLILIEMQLRLADLLQAHWDAGTLERRPELTDLADAPERIERASQRLGAAGQTLGTVLGIFGPAISH